MERVHFILLKKSYLKCSIEKECQFLKIFFKFNFTQGLENMINFVFFNILYLTSLFFKKFLSVFCSSMKVKKRQNIESERLMREGIFKRKCY